MNLERRAWANHKLLLRNLNYGRFRTYEAANHKVFTSVRDNAVLSVRIVNFNGKRVPFMGRYAYRDNPEVVRRLFPIFPFSFYPHTCDIGEAEEALDPIVQEWSRAYHTGTDFNSNEYTTGPFRHFLNTLAITQQEGIAIVQDVINYLDMYYEDKILPYEELLDSVWLPADTKKYTGDCLMGILFYCMYRCVRRAGF